MNREESEEDVASLAVPIPARVPGMRLALNVSAPLHRLGPAEGPTVAGVLAGAAAEIASSDSGTGGRISPG